MTLIFMAVLVIDMTCAIFAPWIAPYGEAKIAGKAFQAASTQHLLGTDQIGRDIFSRLLYGARTSIGIALLTTCLSFLIGGTLGVFAAVLGGWADLALSRLVDALISIPVLVFALMLLAVFGKSIVNLVAILALLDATRVYRLTRAVAIGVVVMDYFEVARLRGEGLAWLTIREILPNIRADLTAEFGIRFCFVFLTIGSLSFLGVGIQPPTADWGSMVAENRTLIIYGNPAPLYPAGAMALLAISVNFVVDWILLSAGGRSRGRP